MSKAMTIGVISLLVVIVFGLLVYVVNYADNQKKKPEKELIVKSPTEILRSEVEELTYGSTLSAKLKSLLSPYLRSSDSNGSLYVVYFDKGVWQKGYYITVSPSDYVTKIETKITNK